MDDSGPLKFIAVLIAVVLVVTEVITFGQLIIIIFAVVIFGTIFLVLWDMFSDFFREANIENERQQRSQKAKKTRERNIKLAAKEYPELLNELSNVLKTLNESQAKPSIEFYEKIEKMCRFCSFLKIAELSDKKRLKDVLIYSRLNVLSFYEENSIKGGEKLAKKISTLIKKLK
tara:strand:+ start:159 stop:680 length:522 start_codon:yes stop_codon:yes gene_type:complete